MKVVNSEKSGQTLSMRYDIASGKILPKLAVHESDGVFVCVFGRVQGRVNES